MTYTLARTTDTEYELRDDAGNVIATFSPPVKVPDDIIDAILDNEIKEAEREVEEDLDIPEKDKPAEKRRRSVKRPIRVIQKGDWEIVDER